MGRQHKRAPQIEPEMLPTPALTDRFKGLGFRPLSRAARFIARWAPLHRTCWGNGTPKLAAARAHVGRRLSPRRRCGGAAPFAWCPWDSRKSSATSASTRLAPAACKASDHFPSSLFACEAPAPSLGPRCLASARFSAPRPRLLASVRICARNLVSSLSLKPHVDFLGVCVKKASFSKERRRKAVFSFALTARHFSPRSRTLGCVVFLLAPRAPMCKRSSQ